MASTYLQPVSKRRRAVSVGLTILVHVLIALLLFNLAPRDFGTPGDQGSLTTFNVGPPAVAERQEQRRKAAPRPRRRAEQAPAPAAPPPPRVVPQVPVPRPAPDGSGVIWMDRDQFAASDITGKGSADDRGDADEAGEDSAAPYGPGEGPGGARLYNAEWVREPTDAELRTYIPVAPLNSWGMIACQTVAGNRVDNCRTLGEAPLGSRIATGMRRAAWQFLIRPPRVNGKPVIGAWVRIRLTFVEGGVAINR